jgi:hypothetical protein
MFCLQAVISWEKWYNDDSRNSDFFARGNMDDILNEAYGIVQCKECPWYKTCVIPMKFTAEDIRRQIEQAAPGTNVPQQLDIGMQNLLSSMATAAQNSLLEGCPVFIQRLRTSPRLAQRLKEFMQNWGSEETKGQ